MKIKPKPLAPPCPSIQPMGDTHTYSSRAPDDEHAPEVEPEPVRPRRPTLKEAFEERLGANPLEESPEASRRDPWWLSWLT